MNRKVLLFLAFIVCANYTFAQNLPAEITDTLKESGLYAFSKEDSQKMHKPFINISAIQKEKYVKMFVTPWIRKDLFPDKNNITYDDIKKTFIDGVNVYDLPSWDYENYSWIKGKNIEYSVVYSISTYYPITGPGNYSIKIFDTDYVYIIGISENKIIDEVDKEYDALKNIFEYQKGQKADANKGLEQTQGYYCNEETAAKLYEKMRKRDSDLPESAKRLQEAEYFLESVLSNY
jgi:hypothetical protein